MSNKIELDPYVLGGSLGLIGVGAGLDNMQYVVAGLILIIVQIISAPIIEKLLAED